MDAATRTAVPRAPWNALLPEFVRQWEQGEHFTIVGPTGEGKTTLEIAALKERARIRGSHTVFLETKPADPTIRGLGWPIIRSDEKWPPGYGVKQVVVWPPYGDPRTHAARQRRVLLPILSDIFKDGSRVVAFDEVADFEDDFGLGKLVGQFFKKGRSNGITAVATTQRPRRVPLPVFTEASWLASFVMTNDDDVRRVAEIGGRVDKVQLREVIGNLGRNEFVLVRVRSGEMVVSKVRSS